MNFTQSFEQFSSSLKPGDLILYAGIGVVLWVLFKDQLSPVQKLLLTVVDKAKSVVNTKAVVKSITLPDQSTISKTDDNALFFELVQSWKQTRDLALKSGCSEAVKVADEMFPYLSPNVCKAKVIA